MIDVHVYTEHHVLKMFVLYFHISVEMHHEDHLLVSCTFTTEPYAPIV